MVTLKKHKKTLLLFSLILAVLVSLSVLLNMTVTTRQGINYEVSTLEIPLYLKVLNFYTRHYNYKWLVGQITGHLKSKNEKIFRLFQWVHEAIKPQPADLPTMDDHPWNVYIRGYGVVDNYHDLFSTLCNYIGVDSYYSIILNESKDKGVYLSLVWLEKGWVFFDPYNGAYFVNQGGSWATSEDIRAGNWKLEKLEGADVTESLYRPFLEALPDIGDIGLRRSNSQSPLNRLILQISTFVSGKTPLLE